MSYLSSVLSSEFIRAFGWTLLHSLWQGLVLFLIASVMIMILRRKSPATRYSAYFILLAMIPVAFMITFMLVYQPGNLKTAGVETMIPAPASVLAGMESHDRLLNPDTEAASWYSSILGFFDRSTHWLFMIWFAGFILFLARFAGSLVYIHRIKRFDLKDAPGIWYERLRELSERIKLRRAVRLAESMRVQIPITAGYLKPVILLPLGTLSGVPPQMIDAILLHELAHIRRKDYLFNIIQNFIEMLFFYHPVTWWLSGLVRAEREHICDDIAISIHHDRINYIKALTTMEELNVKSPVLATAITGQRKQLLHRVTRLIHPEKIHRGFTEGVIGFIMLAMIIIAISANAISYAGSSDETSSPAGISTFNTALPSLFDLTGRETNEDITNFLPSSMLNQKGKSENEPGQDNSAVVPSGPDTVIAKSGSGKVKVMVYTDTIRTGDQEALEIMVETIEDRIEDVEKDRQEIEKEVMIMKREGERLDSMRKVIVIKSGDSVKVISGGRTIVLPGGTDTTIVTEGGYQFYGFGDIPEIPEMPEIADMPELKYFYFNDENFEWADEHEKAMKEYQLQWQEMDELQRQAMKEQQMEMERQLRESRVYVNPPVEPVPQMEWYGNAPVLPDRSTEKIIRQELREDGLVDHGRSYIIEISSKAMFINGEKQSKETAKKYMHLVEGLEPGMLEGSGTYKIVF